MITATALLLERCGLSHREAAEFLSVRPDTVKAWCAGRNPTPPGVTATLRGLYTRIERAAAEALDVIARDGTGADVIELGLAGDDDEAQALGWPCASVHAAMLGIVVARAGRPVRLATRGQSPATAGAVLAHASAEG